jgi:hypothetical protein
VLVARYVEVVAVTRDHASFSSALPRYAVSLGGNPFGGAMTLPFADPPVHTRLRRLVARDFSPRRIALLAPGRNPEVIEFSCMRSVKGIDLKLLADIGVSRVVITRLEPIRRSSRRDSRSFRRKSCRLVAAIACRAKPNEQQFTPSNK